MAESGASEAALGGPFSALDHYNFIEAGAVMRAQYRGCCNTASSKPNHPNETRWLEQLQASVGWREPPRADAPRADAPRAEPPRADAAIERRNRVAMSDIGFGFMVSAVSGTLMRATTLLEACAAGELLPCAMITWMREGHVEATLLTDCTIMCQRGAIPSPAGRGHGHPSGRASRQGKSR